MDRTLGLDYDCPQFFDFAAGLDNSRGSKGDVFFDCDDQPTSNTDVFKNLNLQTPESIALCHASPQIADDVFRYGKKRKRCFSSETDSIITVVAEKKNPIASNIENELLDKMTTALKFIEKTPGVASAAKHKHISESSTFKNPRWQFTGTSCKPGRTTGMKRSKSVVSINKVAEKAKVGLRKRSSSLSDLRHIKKCPAKVTTKYPTTPMCLKRTIVKSKNKVVKSSEDIELEEIARLRKHMTQMLRQNEMTLKKLNLKPRAVTCTKNIITKTENTAKIKPENNEGTCKKGLNSVTVETNFLKDTRQQNKPLPPKPLINLNSAFNRPNFKPVGDKEQNLCPMKCRKTIMLSESEASDKAEFKPVKKSMNKIGVHAGIMFHGNVKKNTVAKPFSLSTKPKQTRQSSAATASSFPRAASNVKLDDGKENIPVTKVQSVFQLMKKEQKGMAELTPVNKILERRKTIKSRGLVLSTNTVRD